jgi:nucleoside-diphosphate-sugar epimerase
VSEGPSSSGVPAGPRRAGRCLVSGASGFIGGRLTERLVRDGRAVRCLVRASSDISRLQELDVEIAVGDLRSAASLARAVEGCEEVLHCAALVSDWATTDEIVAANVEGTRNLLEASADARVRRFVHLSTTDVYGHPDAAVDETYTATRFRNWYSQTKLEAERDVRRVAETTTLEAVVLRPATVYGPGSVDVVGELARAIRGRHMLLVDHGRAVAGLCYVENLIDAAVLAMHHQAAPGQAFNVSDGLDITWRDFTDALAQGLDCPRVRWSLPYRVANGIGFALESAYRLLRSATGLHTPALLSRQAVQVLGNDQAFSTRKIQDMLGWEPRVDYATGLAATLAWLKTEHLRAD